MVADTLRQKFIYATPYDRNEFPLVELDKELNSSTKNTYKINASALYFLEKADFESLVDKIKREHDSILIIDDYHFKSTNVILNKGCLCHMMTFAYLFKQKQLKCNIVKMAQ